MGQIKELEFMIGQRVLVRSAVKVCYMDKLADVAGTLQFIGSNNLLDIPLIVTINRMPIEIHSLKQIETEGSIF